MVAFVTWVLGAFYTLHGNPEIRFFKHAARAKQAWAKRMTEEFQHKTVFFGGSSCTFSVDPERLLKEHHLPAANMGLGAGMGLRVLTRFALEQANPGDTLLMAMEPPVLLGPLEETMLGAQISFALDRPGWLAHGSAIDSSRPVSWLSSALMLRPGGYHTITLLGKVLSHKPLYRYAQSEIRVSGWQQSPLRRPAEPAVGAPGPLPLEVRQYLTALRQWCEAHQIRIAYSLPWAYTDAEHLAELQRNNIRLLQDIATIFPVLKDSRLGADTDKEHFADTGWHLTQAAAAARTDDLAQKVKAWDVWSAEELRTLPANEHLP